jgi:mono/diheme cytochrome c family protein
LAALVLQPRVRLLVSCVLAAALLGCESSLPPIDPLARAAPDATLVARGAALAAVGNCHGCHTRRGGEAYAGGEPMHSPYGTIYSTNITPDPDTGIGLWSEAAFQRAMRKGVRRDGKHLYPAFPYDRFTRVTDEDDRALYAYLMSLPVVRYVPPSNALPFPFNVRAGLAAWKALFFREGPAPPDPAKDALLARGEYLVEGLAHCGSCHTPRNLLFAEKRGRAYDGGDLEGWHAYAINAKAAMPIPWDPPSLAFYLRHGYHPRHGVSRGTMGLVTSELARAPQEDLDAIATYVVSMMGPVSEERRSRALQLLRDPLSSKPSTASEGATIYATTCLACHDGSRPLPFGGIPLALSLGLHGESPRNLINVVVHGMNPGEGETSPMMPGFAGALSDAQIESLVHWLRAHLTDKPPWTGVDKLIRESRGMKQTMLLFPPGGTGAQP